MDAIQRIRRRRAFRRIRQFRDRRNPLENLNDTELISRYRFSRIVIEEVHEKIKADIELPTARGGHVISSIIQLLVTLRFLAKNDLLSEVGDLHGISRSSCSRIIQKVCAAIAKHFPVRYPSSPAAVRERKEGFYNIAGFPNCTGCIDGTLIPIQAPAGDIEASYVCRKGYHAINVQAVCDHNMKFTNVVVRWPGSTHDAFMLTNSSLQDRMEENADGWLLGDSGYPLKPWLMTPFLNPAAGCQTRYNIAHAKTRNIIERAFGVLKSRFRCLQYLISSPERAVGVIYACFCLHNLAVDRNMPVPCMNDINIDHDDFVQHDGTGRGSEVRNRLAQRF